MKKALFFISNNDYMALDEAIEKCQNGYDIYFVLCDSSVRGCNVCRACDKATCKLCAYTMKKLIRPLLKTNHAYHMEMMANLITSDIKRQAEDFSFDYHDVKSLKTITFHGVEIGYGAFSTFVTYTRNVMPTFNETLKDYLDALMRAEVRETLALEKYVFQLKPDLIVFHNGRFANLKPLLNIAKNNKIDYIVTEQWNLPGGIVKRNFFFNDIPHSYEAYVKKFEIAWKNAGDKGAEIGKAFYENRRFAKYAGDTIYTKDQKKDLLPENFDSNKRNISIFNSSEDEFFAVSKEWDESVLYPNQYIALKTIFEHYKDDNTVHFYLRIHPNLKNVPWKSHTLLYQLEYPNVTIIPPSSPISSYALMDKSEKVIVFNSTMGLESTYWGKPVIALNRCTYSLLHQVYEPQNENEMYDMIDNVDLTPLRDETNCFKAACYYMGYAAEDYRHFQVSSYRIKHNIEVIPILKLFGSPVLYAYTRRLLSRISTIVGSGRRFKNLAERTA